MKMLVVKEPIQDCWWITLGTLETRLCENCVTESCTVVMGAAFAMGVPPIRFNSFSYLQTKWHAPKAGVTGSIRGRCGRRTGRIPVTWFTPYSWHIV